MNEVEEFAAKIKSWGFRIWFAERGYYGFISDDTLSRVLTFNLRDGTLGNCYGPPSTESGTGWRLHGNPWTLKNPDHVRELLYEYPTVRQCGNGWKYLTTVDQHLKMYGPSSRYREV